MTSRKAVPRRDLDRTTGVRRFEPAAKATARFARSEQLTLPSVQPPASLGIQAKLEISQPGDALEQEADRVAESVMRMPLEGFASHQPPRTSTGQGSPLEVVQRACSACSVADEDRIQRAAEHSHAEDAGVAQSDWSRRFRAAQASGGEPLSQCVRQFMEPRFGTRFDRVRVHHDQTSGKLASAIAARAFTSQNHVFFNRGEFEPGTERGRRLLAHELAHVTQQTNAAPKRLPNQAPTNDTMVSSHSIFRQSNPNTGPDHLKSPRFSPNAKLELCYEDKYRLRAGDPDSDAVTRIQQALKDLQPLTGHTYDLGTTGPNHDGVDGKFGSKTAEALKQFKADENLGFTEFGDVGPGVMHRLDDLFQAAGPAPTPTPPTPTPPPPPVPTGPVCGPDVSAETSKAWSSAISRFNGFSFSQKVNNCRLLVQPINGGQLNQDAFDTWGLFQGSVGWTRVPPWHGPCGSPGSTGDPHDNFDPAHEDATKCSNTVKIGSDCWLSGTPNYGLFGIAMRACWDFTAPLTGIPIYAALHDLFGLPALAILVGAYKLYKGDNIVGPEKWAIAAWAGGPGATVSGGNRPNCAPTCGGPAPPPFFVVWEPNMPRSAMPMTWPYFL